MISIYLTDDGKLRELEPEFIDFVLEALSRREGGAYVTADSRLY